MFQMCGISIIAFFSLFQSWANQDPEGSFEIPTVTYCQLVESEALYTQTTVRLRARYVVGFETASFDNDPKCSCGSGWLMGVIFAKGYETSTEKKIYNRFKRLLRSKPTNGPLRKIDVTVVGRFNGLREGIKLGDRVIAQPYDGRYKYQFVVQKLEDVQMVNE